METTHTSSQANRAPALTMQQFKDKLATDYSKHVVNYFSGNKDEARRFMGAIVYCVQKIPKLLECDRESLFTAFMTCAEFNMFPSNVGGEVYVIPYNGKAQFQFGYKGLITLAYRAGTESIATNIVYANDHFEYEEGMNPKLIHKPAAFGKDRGEAVGVYAVASINGGNKIFKVLSKADVMRFKNLSQAKASQYSPWNSAQDPELHMWRKTAIKQLCKTLPTNERLQKALDKDNKEDSTLPTLELNAEGPAVGKAAHGPAAVAPAAPKADVQQEAKEELPVINLGDEPQA